MIFEQMSVSSACTGSLQTLKNLAADRYDGDRCDGDSVVWRGRVAVCGSHISQLQGIFSLPVLMCDTSGNMGDQL